MLNYVILKLSILLLYSFETNLNAFSWAFDMLCLVSTNWRIGCIQQSYSRVTVWSSQSSDSATTSKDIALPRKKFTQLLRNSYISFPYVSFKRLGCNCSRTFWNWFSSACCSAYRTLFSWCKSYNIFTNMGWVSSLY